MKRNATNAVAIFAVTLWVCTALGVIVRAQQNPPAPTEVKPSDTTQLNDESLKTMLTNMGLEPSALTKGFLVKIKQDTWTLNIQLVLSPDKRKLGFNANMGKVEDAASISADKWLALLVANADIDPSSFYFDKQNSRLLMHRVADNRNITPAILKTDLDNFSRQIKETSELWKFTK